MGIVVNKQISPLCKLGVWKIREDFQQLKSLLNLDTYDTGTLEGFKNHKRKLEWMAVRVLLNELTEKNNKILYNGNRRPYLSDHSYNISISHSDRYTTVLLCKDKHVGIDIEKIHPKIEHIAFKFMKKQEIERLDPSRRIYHMYLHWCAKEALYKICDKKRISFKEHLLIEPFIPREKGSLVGRVETSDIRLRLNLYYFALDNYSVVWCYKE